MLKLTAAERRAVIDDIAWATIDSRPPGLLSDCYRGRRPTNYGDMWRIAEVYVPHPNEGPPLPGTWPAFEHAFSEFLHAFYQFKSAAFFALPPPSGFGAEICALLAGVAEYLCRRYDLDLPDWIDHPQFRLPVLWDPVEDMFPDSRGTRYRRCQRSEPEFLSRNVVFEARNLIAL